MKISASLMCADLLNLEASIRQLEKTDIEMYHIDIMDGHFVPNLSLNFDTLAAIQKIATKPLDVHLMVTNPQDYISKLAALNVDYIVFHLETCNNPIRLLNEIRALGIKGGIALNPKTDPLALQYLLDYVDLIVIMTVEPGFAGQKFIPSQLSKISAVKNMCQNRDILIEVDGNITLENARNCYNLGADIGVLGTSVLFKADADYIAATTKFRNYVTNIISI